VHASQCTIHRFDQQCISVQKTEGKKGTNEGYKTSNKRIWKTRAPNWNTYETAVPIAGSSGVNNLKALYTP
jgi:hypothetical protein